MKKKKDLKKKEGDTAIKHTRVYVLIKRDGDGLRVRELPAGNALRNNTSLNFHVEILTFGDPVKIFFFPLST